MPAHLCGASEMQTWLSGQQTGWSPGYPQQFFAQPECPALWSSLHLWAHFVSCQPAIDVLYRLLEGADLSLMAPS